MASLTGPQNGDPREIPSGDRTSKARPSQVFFIRLTCYSKTKLEAALKIRRSPSLVAQRTGLATRKPTPKRDLGKTKASEGLSGTVPATDFRIAADRSEITKIG